MDSLPLSGLVQGNMNLQCLLLCLMLTTLLCLVERMASMGQALSIWLIIFTQTTTKFRVVCHYGGDNTQGMLIHYL
ncbi:putative tail fiber protein [Acinetobacter phage Ab69]|nr:putative tail fiber protein [Acinetobacter phage Ab69]